MHITELIGKGILDKNANAMGKVTDINVNFPEWKIKRTKVKVSLF